MLQLDDIDDIVSYYENKFKKTSVAVRSYKNLILNAKRIAKLIVSCCNSDKHFRSIVNNVELNSPDRMTLCVSKAFYEAFAIYMENRKSKNITINEDDKIHIDVDTVWQNNLCGNFPYLYHVLVTNIKTNSALNPTATAETVQKDNV